MNNSNVFGGCLTILIIFTILILQGALLITLQLQMLGMIVLSFSFTLAATLCFMLIGGMVAETYRDK